MSAGSHHRVQPGQAVTEHEAGRLFARQERRVARATLQALTHLRIRDAAQWAAMSAETQRGYDDGWRSTL